MKKSKIYLAIATAMPTANLFAQQLNEISIVALRDASSYSQESNNISKITNSYLAQEQPASVSQALQYNPNISISGGARVTNQQPDIRGLTGNRIAQVIDGVKQNFELKNRGSYFLPISMVHAIDVIKGPSSTLWGSGSLGGVVAMRTYNALDLLDEGQKIGAKVTQGYQSANNLWETSGMFYGANNSVDGLVGTFYNHADNIHLGDGEILENSAYIQKGALIKLGWQINDYSRLSFTQRLIRIDQNSPNDNRMSNAKEPQIINFVDFINGNGMDHLAKYKYTFLSRQKIQDDSSILDYNFNPNKYVDGQLTVYRNYTSEKEKWLKNPEIKDKTAYTTYGVNLKNSTDFENIYLTYGIDFAHNKVDTHRSRPPIQNNVNDPNFDYNRRLKEYNGYSKNTGAYLLSHFAFFDSRLILSPSIRYDHYAVKGDGNFENMQVSGSNPEFSTLNNPKYKDDHFSPSLSITAKPFKFFTVNIKYNEAFRAPSLQESFANGYLFSLKTKLPVLGIMEFPALLYANPNLKPEIAQNKEITAKLHFDNLILNQDKLEFTATYFRNDIKNLITPELIYYSKSILDHRLVGQYINIPKAKIFGYELSLDYTMPRLILGVGFGATKGVITKIDKNNPFFYDALKDKYYLNVGDPLDDIPANKLTVKAEYFLLPEELKVGTILSFYWAQRNISKSYIKNWSDGTPFNHYNLVSLNASYTPKGKFKNLQIDFVVDNLFDKKYRPAFSLVDGVGRNFKLNVGYKF